MDKRHKLNSFKKNEGFKTPDAYFDSLSSRVMSSLPKSEEAHVEPVDATIWMKLKPITYLAAMFIGAALIIKVALPTFSIQDDSVVAEVVDLDDVDGLSDQFIQETVDGAMFDDYSMYVYLSENIDSYDE